MKVAGGLSQRWSAWARMAAIPLALVVLIILPFLLWGEQVERVAPALLASGKATLVVAGVGIALLITDIALPIPSSVISVSLCLLLGPMLGAVSIIAGMLGSFIFGYVLGRWLPRDALRRWVGHDVWDSVSRQAARSGPLWIMASRPVPVLAEATSVISGSLGVPFRPALLAALLSSTAVAACYAAAVMVGLSNGGFGLAFAASLLLAGLLWLVSKRWRRRMSGEKWMTVKEV